MFFCTKARLRLKFYVNFSLQNTLFYRDDLIGDIAVHHARMPGRGAARIFLRGGAETVEAKALKRKNCL